MTLYPRRALLDAEISADACVRVSDDYARSWYSSFWPAPGLATVQESSACPYGHATVHSPSDKSGEAVGRWQIFPNGNFYLV